MGNEAICEAEITGRSGRSTGPGKALLETDELIFRWSGPPRGRGLSRLRIALKDVTRAGADGGVLVVETIDGTIARFDVGKAAARWAEKITAPPSRLDKLGVKADIAVSLVGAFDDDFVREIGARAKSRGSIVFFAAGVAKDLARVPALRKKTPDDGALWIVYPKGRKEIREADVLAAGRAAGMKDVKVARFSETHTALKFVVPVADRK